MTAAVASAVLTDDQKWDNWKKDGARQEQRRRERMRMVFAAVCISGAVWMMFFL